MLRHWATTTATTAAAATRGGRGGISSCCSRSLLPRFVARQITSSPLAAAAAAIPALWNDAVEQCSFRVSEFVQEWCLGWRRRYFLESDVAWDYYCDSGCAGGLALRHPLEALLSPSYHREKIDSSIVLEGDAVWNMAVPKKKVTRHKKRLKTTVQKRMKPRTDIIPDPRTGEITLRHKLPFNWKDYLPGATKSAE